MRILVLGGTGRTGRHVIEQALQKKYEVHALVRKKEALENKANLTIFEGSPLEIDDLSKALAGCHAVINTLNISRTSDFPWSRLRTPQNLISATAKNLISLSKANDIRRYVLCSAWGTAETRQDMPGWFEFLVYHSNIGAAYHDHENQEMLWEASFLNWTLVKPVALTNSLKKQIAIESYQNVPKPKPTISRLCLANYLLSIVDDPTSFRKKPVLSANSFF